MDVELAKGWKDLGAGARVLCRTIGAGDAGVVTNFFALILGIFTTSLIVVIYKCNVTSKKIYTGPKTAMHLPAKILPPRKDPKSSSLTCFLSGWLGQG